MELVVKELGFKLTPHRDGLCYELHEWADAREHRGKPVAAGWRFTGSYPLTIQQGLGQTYDRAVLADKSVLATVESAVKRMKEIRNTVVLESKWEEES
jgi:hypothetical protein